MYGVISKFIDFKQSQSEDWTQELFAEQLTESSTEKNKRVITQTRISHWAGTKGGKSYKYTCDRLRDFVNANTENAAEWMRFLSSSYGQDAFKHDLKDLLFLSSDFKIPNINIWVISNMPAECSVKDMQTSMTDNIKLAFQNNITYEPLYIYWVPETSLPRMDVLVREIQRQGSFTNDEIRKSITIIISPETLCLTPYVIHLPTDNDLRVGFFSQDSHFNKNTTVQVLPKTTSDNIANTLSTIYSSLTVEPNGVERLGFNWKIHTTKLGEANE